MDSARQAMRQLALLLIFVALAIAQRPLPQHLHRSTGGLRMAGGALAYRGQFPYQAGLILDAAKFCAGALVHKQYVLTTAVCVESLKETPEKINVILGARNIFDSEPEKGYVQVQAQSVELMDSYDLDQPVSSNTLALVKLQTIVDVNNDTIQTIDLPSGEIKGSYSGEEVTVAGWGITGEHDYISYWLTFATPTVLQDEDCKRAFDFIDPAKIMCTRGRYNANNINGGSPTGPCLGDDGAPAVLQTDQKPTLVGILSFMARCGSTQPSGFLLINTRASAWIQGILAANT